MTVITSIIMLGRKGPGVKQEVFSPAFKRTIGDIPDITKANPRYVDISFLGAHDANTGIAKQGERLEKVASPALKKFEPIVQNYLFRYVQTQIVPIYELLKFGCRFVHIKVTRYDDCWYTSHSVLTGKMETHILDILRFLGEKERHGEIVSVLFQPIYLGDQTLSDLHDDIAKISYEGKNLFDYVHYAPVDQFRTGDGVKVGDLRYNDVIGKDGTSGVVLFMRRDQHYLPDWDKRPSSYPYFFDMDSNALHVWHDHANVCLLDKGIEKVTNDILSTDKYNGLLRLNQTQAASAFNSFADVVSAIYSRSLLLTAKKHNVKLLESKNFDKMLRAMPVFQVDFLTSGYKDFNRRINFAIRKYNEDLVKALLQ